MPQLMTFLASIVFAALLYFSLIAGIDGDRNLAAIARLDGLDWLAILGLSLVNYGLRFIRWYGYMRWLGHRVPLVRHVMIYIAGFAMTTTPGKAGEGLRAVYLARDRVPYAHTVAALFAERLLDLMAICVLAVLGIISFTGYVYWAILPLAALIGVLVLIHRRPLLQRAEAAVAEPDTWLKHGLHMLVHAWERAFVLLSWRPLVGGLLLGCLAWMAEGVSLYLIATWLGAPLGLTTAIGIYAMSMLIGALSFIPGGLGSTEAAMTVLLKLAGLSAGVALGVTLIVRIATLWFAIALGVLCLAGIEIYTRWPRRRAKTEVSV